MIERLEVGNGICRICEKILDPSRCGNPLFCKECEEEVFELIKEVIVAISAESDEA